MKKLVLALLVSGGVSLPAMASDFYLHGDIGYADADGFIDYRSDSKLAYSLGGGYRINSTFALEVAYRELGSWEEEPFFEGGEVGETLEFSALQASVLGQLPINDNFSAYGRLAIADLEMEIKTVDAGSAEISKTKFGLGLGASYAINPALQLRGEYLQYSKFYDLTLSTLSVGVTYQF